MRAGRTIERCRFCLHHQEKRTGHLLLFGLRPSEPAPLVIVAVPHRVGRGSQACVARDLGCQLARRLLPLSATLHLHHQLKHSSLPSLLAIRPATLQAS